MTNIKLFSKVKNKNRKPKQVPNTNLRVADIFWQKGLWGLISEQLDAEQKKIQEDQKIKNE